MKMMKLLIAGAACCLLTGLSGNAFATENYFAEIEKDLVDGVLTVKADDPANNPDIFEIVYGNLVYKYGLDIEYDWENKDYYHVTLVKYGEEHEVTYEADDGSWSYTNWERDRLAEKPITISYTGVNQKNKSKISALMDPIIKKNGWDSHDWEAMKKYVVNDMAFVNFVAAGYGRYDDGEDGEYAWKLITDRTANFSPDYKKDFGNKNIQLVIDNRAGDGEPFFEESFGFAAVVSDGYVYDVIPAVGAQVIREVFIPSTTAESHDAYVAAAQKRIDDYYEGTSLEGAFIVSYGGPICDIICDFEEDGLWADPDFNGDAYYLLEYDGDQVDFIIQKNDSKMITPTFTTGDVGTDVIVRSDDPTIPLDTTIVVNIINKNERKEALEKLGLSSAKIYDIDLHSDVANMDIHELENGKFEVSIPVGAKYNGQTLHVYYVGQDDSVEEFDAPVSNGYAVFETTHFSEYILDINDVSNPATFDAVKIIILVAIGCGAVLLTSLKASAKRR